MNRRYDRTGTVAREEPVLLGQYGDLQSPIKTDLPTTYLQVRLNDGKRWTHSPDGQHELAWLAVNEVTLQVAVTILEPKLAIFGDRNSPIEVQSA